MPIYEYRCKTCTNVFEIKMTIDEKKKTKVKCPECSSEDVQQQFFGISFSGARTDSGTFSGGCCGGGSDCCS